MKISKKKFFFWGGTFLTHTVGVNVIHVLMIMSLGPWLGIGLRSFLTINFGRQHFKVSGNANLAKYRASGDRYATEPMTFKHLVHSDLLVLGNVTELRASRLK